MKILYSAAGTPIPGTHGGSVHALELCRALSRRGHEVHLVALRSSAPSTDLDGVVLHPLRRWLPTTLLEWTASGAVRRLAARIEPDVVIERFYTFGGAGIIAAHRLGIPAVLEVNSPARPYPGSLRDTLDRLTLIRPVDRWRQRVLRRSSAVYTTSAHLVPPELQKSATVIVNGVDTRRFTPGEPTLDTGPLKCVYVSSFRSWHGAEDLVAALSDCVRRRVAIHVTCIGTGPRFKIAAEAAAEAGLNASIEFVGKIPHREVPKYLAAADVGLAPFAPDRFSALELSWFWSPIKIFEYMAAGLPVITADIVELRELLPEGVANFYRPGDPVALTEALIEMAQDRDAVRHMGAAARQLVEERYTWDHQAAVVEKVLEGVAGDT